MPDCILTFFIGFIAGVGIAFFAGCIFGVAIDWFLDEHDISKYIFK